jgi:DNA-directed RNA polymerase specialized sigma24 family protein
LHYLEGCTLAETAQQVDLSISGVRKRLLTLRERSRALLAGHA